MELNCHFLLFRFQGFKIWWYWGTTEPCLGVLGNVPHKQVVFWLAAIWPLNIELVYHHFYLPSRGLIKLGGDKDRLSKHLQADLQIILSLMGIWFIDPNPTAKSGKKMAKIIQNQSKNVKKYPKRVGFTLKILLMPKNAK